MNVLIACEESQRVCEAFREKGHNAFSCDIIDCGGDHPEWHIKQDVLTILSPQIYSVMEDERELVRNVTPQIMFQTVTGDVYGIPKWDLIIAHPPCTYLTVTGNRWFNEEKYGDKARERKKLREEAVEFFMTLANADCDKIAIENPIGIMSTRWRKPDQIVQPYWFGDPFEKRTCLWLKGLKPLTPTNMIEPEERVKFKSGKSMPAWYVAAANLPKEERSKIRSRTFSGFAKAMAEQWG